MENDSQATDGPYSVYCLCVDMIESTKAGLELLFVGVEIAASACGLLAMTE